MSPPSLAEIPQIQAVQVSLKRLLSVRRVLALVTDRQQVRKWPILGDMPLIGQLFRQSSSSREKNELVIIVTPTILDDEQGGRFGYGYRPGTPAGRQLVQSEI